MNTVLCQVINAHTRTHIHIYICTRTHTFLRVVNMELDVHNTSIPAVCVQMGINAVRAANARNRNTHTHDTHKHKHKHTYTKSHTLVHARKHTQRPSTHIRTYTYSTRGCCTRGCCCMRHESIKKQRREGDTGHACAQYSCQIQRSVPWKARIKSSCYWLLNLLRIYVHPASV